MCSARYSAATYTHPVVCVSDFWLKGLSSYTTTAAAAHWRRTNHDIRAVQAALKTIVLCAGGEPRRGLAGQRLFSVDWRAAAAVSTSVCISDTHAFPIQHESLNRFMLNPFALMCVSLCLCVFVCVCVCVCEPLFPGSFLAQERRDGGGVGEPQRKKHFSFTVAKQRSNGQRAPPLIWTDSTDK